MRILCQRYQIPAMSSDEQECLAGICSDTQMHISPILLGIFVLLAIDDERIPSPASPPPMSGSYF